MWEWLTAPVERCYVLKSWLGDHPADGMPITYHTLLSLNSGVVYEEYVEMVSFETLTEGDDPRDDEVAVTAPVRVGQTWQENDKIFVVVGPPVSRDFWDRHPVCYLDDKETGAETFVDEGEIAWESQPYMQRLA